jgi:uncharacterized protein (TIGR02099 family)
LISVLKTLAVWRLFAHLIFIVLVASALLLTVVRFWLLPHANTYKPKIEAQLSSVINETLLIGDVSAAMHGLDLRLILRDCTSAREDGVPSAFDARRVALTIDTIASLFAQAPIFRRVEIEGIRLTAHTRADGSIGLLGISAKSESPAWLSTVKNLQLRDVTLGWQNDQAVKTEQHLLFGKADIEFRTLDNTRRQLSLRLDPVVDIGDSLYFSTEVRGEVFAPESWQGRFYLEGVGIRPGLWRNVKLPVKWPSGAANMRIWGDFSQAKLQHLAGSLALQYFELHYASDSVRLGRLNAIFNWKQQQHNTELLVRDLAFAPSDSADVNNRLSLRVLLDASGNIVTLGAAIDILQLSEVKELLRTISSLGNDTQSLLAVLSPVGSVHDARVFYETRQSATAFCGRFSDVGFNALGKVPGVSALNGRACGSNERGTLNLAMRDGRVFGEELWPKPLSIKAFNAQIDWRQDQRGLVLTGRNVVLHHRDNNIIQLGFDFIAPSDPAQLPVLDLFGWGDGFHAEHVAEVLPVFAMDKNAAEWLHGAFVSGRLSDLRFLFRGAVAQFPFDGAEGVFEAAINGSDLQVHYDPHWPDLYNVRGRLLLKNVGYFAEIEQGTVDDFPLTSVRISAPEYMHHPWVYVEGGFGGELSSILAALEHTPEKPLVDRLNWFGHPSGRADFDLKLRLPLDIGIGDGEVDGRLSLKNVRMDIDLNGASRGKLSQLSGDIHFSGNDITAPAIKGQLFGGPLNIGLEHEAGRVMLTAQGRLQAMELSKYFPHALWTHISGETPYSLDVSFPAAIDAPGSADDIELKVHSDLVGIESRLPAPFAKNRVSAQPLHIEWDKLADTRSLMKISYGQDKKARFYFTDKLHGFDVALGAVPLPELSERPLRRFYVDFPELDMTQWDEFLRGNMRAGTNTPDNLPDIIHVRLGRLAWRGKDYGSLQINADRKGSDWSGWLDTLYGAGRFDYIHDGLGAGTVSLDLDRIVLPAGSDRSKSDPIDPSRLPSIKVQSRSVDWQGHDLGALTLEAEHWMRGLNISRFKLVSPYSSVQLRGSWMEQGQGSETSLSGSLNSDNLGSMIESLGFAKEVRDTPTKSSFSLAWAGGPHQFSPATLVGDMSFSLGRGSLLNVDPGLGRAAILLNLDTLRRLLMFDFRDLFGQGLTYDSIRGKYHFAHGQAVTNRLLIDAVVAEIAISGSIGLVARDIDQRVDVMPHALAALPFAGALVPGVVVGAAVNMAEFLAGKDEASLTSNHYVIKGSWDSPNVYRAQGNLPLDMLGRAWTDLKNVSGFGKQEEK